jgi:ankyrin repeat protein
VTFVSMLVGIETGVGGDTTCRALIMAAGGNHEGAVDLLLSLDITSLDGKDRFGWSALSVASIHENTKIAQRLI